MAFFHEFRQRLRVKRWRKLRVRLRNLERDIFTVETTIDADLYDHTELDALLQNRRRARNRTLRQLRNLETKERNNVQG